MILKIRRKTMNVLISFILMSALSFGKVNSDLNTKYQFSSPECSSIYLPFGNSIDDLIQPQVKNDFAYVSTSNKKMSIQFRAKTRSADLKTFTAEFKEKYFSDSFETKRSAGNLFFNGRFYKWQITRISSYEIQIDSYSKVVFLGLPTISNLTCILTEAE
jgi:hypothetical protein